MDAQSVIASMSEVATYPKRSPTVGGLYISAYYHEADLKAGCPQLLLRVTVAGQIEEFDPSSDRWNTTTKGFSAIQGMLDGTDLRWYYVSAEAMLVVCGMWHRMWLQPVVAKEILVALYKKL